MYKVTNGRQTRKQSSATMKVAGVSVDAGERSTGVVRGIPAARVQRHQIGPNRHNFKSRMVLRQSDKTLEKLPSSGYIEAVISACCTADEIPANAGDRHQD